MEAYIKIATLENMLEAQLVESILKENEIPYRIRSFHDTAYDGLFQFQKGWGEIYAPTESKDAMMDILDMVRAEQ